MVLYHHLEDIGSFLFKAQSFRVNRIVGKSFSCRSIGKSEEVPLYLVCILEGAPIKITTMVAAITENQCKFYDKI